MMKGQYLPLSVLGTMGYDTDLIEKNCKDVEEHELLGKTYRVNIRHIEWGDVYSKTETDLLEFSLNNKKRKSKETMPDGSDNEKNEKNKKRKKAKKEETSSSSSSSKSSQSSSASEPVAALSKAEKRAKAAEDGLHACMCNLHSGVDRHTCNTIHGAFSSLAASTFHGAFIYLAVSTALTLISYRGLAQCVSIGERSGEDETTGSG